MTYAESRKEILKVKWKLIDCTTQNCWCAGIVPQSEMVCDDGEVYVVGFGEISKPLAKYFVKLHNNYIRAKK